MSREHERKPKLYAISDYVQYGFENDPLHREHIFYKKTNLNRYIRTYKTFWEKRGMRFFVEKVDVGKVIYTRGSRKGTSKQLYNWKVTLVKK